MGWERKRGKLAEFNRLRPGRRGERASPPSSGDVAALREIRYVITLDADTVLPPDAAPLLIGALAHPLNRAVFDPARGRVVRGYGILQPRVGVTPPERATGRASRRSTRGIPGWTPTPPRSPTSTRICTAKGASPARGSTTSTAFERRPAGASPRTSLLSHDLIEGNYARAGLVTDIVVYDDYPTRYLTFTLRKHRWIRGDWQLLPWLRARVPGPDGPEPNRLSLLSRWKILDNLRRSLVEPA